MRAVTPDGSMEYRRRHRVTYRGEVDAWPATVTAVHDSADALAEVIVRIPQPPAPSGVEWLSESDSVTITYLRIRRSLLERYPESPYTSMRDLIAWRDDRWVEPEYPGDTHRKCPMREERCTWEPRWEYQWLDSAGTALLRLYLEHNDRHHKYARNPKHVKDAPIAVVVHYVDVAAVLRSRRAVARRDSVERLARARGEALYDATAAERRRQRDRPVVGL